MKRIVDIDAEYKTKDMHKNLARFAKTLQDARALHVSEGVLIPVVIEKVYSK